MIMRSKSNNLGITLIALVVTIVVLMILAGIVVATLMGNNGLITRAIEAKESQRGAAVFDEVTLIVAENAMIDKLNAIKGENEAKKTKAKVVEDLVEKGFLKDEESDYLLGTNGKNEQDTITIGSIIIDFSSLNSGTEVPKGPNGKPLINQTTISEITNEKIVGEDKYGNQVVIPAGFKLAQGENGSGDCVKEGIVIDDGEGDAVGNQYVWIPVSNINHDGSNKIKLNSKSEDGIEITLGRYSFSTSSPGNPALEENSFQYASSYTTPVTIQSYYQELTNARDSNRLQDATGTNSTAQGIQVNGVWNGIQGFIESVETNKGYYIARYEASYREIDGRPKAGSIQSISSPETLALTSKPSTRTAGDLWNFVEQGEASMACRALYTTINSDLTNSYAWDTTLVYIQTMGNTNYANAIDGNGVLKNTGDTEDEKCKIFDLAYNEFEWTTEYSSYEYNSTFYYCVYRGGNFTSESRRTSSRLYNRILYASRSVSFRPVLYF